MAIGTSLLNDKRRIKQNVRDHLANERTLIAATGALTLFISLLRFQRTKMHIIRNDYQSTSGALMVLVAFIIVISPLPHCR